MKSLGIRCWKDKYSYVIVEGTQETPTCLIAKHIPLPKNSTRPEQLAWFRREIKELMDINDIDVAIFKATEPISQSKDPARGELEGILQETIYSHPKPTTIEKRIKSQLTSNTNATKAKYLGELLEHEAFNKLSKNNYEDACVAALSGLPKK